MSINRDSFVIFKPHKMKPERERRVRKGAHTLTTSDTNRYPYARIVQCLYELCFVICVMWLWFSYKYARWLHHHPVIMINYIGFVDKQHGYLLNNLLAPDAMKSLDFLHYFFFNYYFYLSNSNRYFSFRGWIGRFKRLK